MQCVLCIRARVEQRKSYACSTDCLRQHWSEHKALHQNGETTYEYLNLVQRSQTMETRQVKRDIFLLLQEPTSMATRLKVLSSTSL